MPEFNDAEIEKSYKEHMSKMFSLYDELCENGVLREDARFVLPYCLYSNFFCSVNGREFLNMLSAMICGRGAKYPEIKKLGLELYEQALTRAPGIMASFNPEKTINDLPDLSFIDVKPEHTATPVELLAYTPDAAKCVARNALIADKNYSTEQIEKIMPKSIKLIFKTK